MRRVAVAVLALVLAAACGPRTVRLPEGAGSPYPGFADAFTQASAGCRDVRTLTAELGVAGRVAGNRIRGRVLAGFERPGRIRLEAVAPFGPPAFILAATGPDATLLMPRGSQVLSNVAVNEILEALIGVSLRPDALQAILSGCAAPDPAPTSGQEYPGGWLRVELEGGIAAYLRQQDGKWAIRAARAPLWAADYTRGTGRLPDEILLRSSAIGDAASELRVTLSQVDINVPIDQAAFAVKIPADAVPITLHELRQSGPLGERR